VSRFVWLDSRGNAESRIGGGMERSTNFALSHDGRFIAAEQPASLALHDVERGATSPLPVDGTDPIWSPDDSEIAYTVPRDGIYAVPRFGGQPRLLYKSTQATYAEDWSRDGRWLAAVSMNDGVLVPLPSGSPISLGVATSSVAADELQFSPDSQWLAYGTVQTTGTNQVYLTTVPPSGQRFQLSVAGGSTPRWAPDGRSLYFLDTTGTLMKVDIVLQKGAPPKLGTPRRIADGVKRLQPTLDQFSVSRDGRFLIRDDELAPGSTEAIQIIVNWPGLVKTNPK
jgi:tricorn protease-like protein